jgi:hypothetical protein
MVHGYVKTQCAHLADALWWAIDTLGAADVDIEEFDGTVIVADRDARFGAALV